MKPNNNCIFSFISGWYPLQTFLPGLFVAKWRQKWSKTNVYKLSAVQSVIILQTSCCVNCAVHFSKLSGGGRERGAIGCISITERTPLFAKAAIGFSFLSGQNWFQVDAHLRIGCKGGSTKVWRLFNTGWEQNFCLMKIFLELIPKEILSWHG